MKNNALRKGILIVMLLALPLLLSGCVVGSAVQNTSSSDRRSQSSQPSL